MPAGTATISYENALPIGVWSEAVVLFAEEATCEGVLQVTIEPATGVLLELRSVSLWQGVSAPAWRAFLS